MGDGKELTHSGMHISRCLHNTFGRFKEKKDWLISSQSQTREKLDCIICLPFEGTIILFCAKTSTPAYSPPRTVFMSKNILERGCSCSKVSNIICATEGSCIVSVTDHLMQKCQFDCLVLYNFRESHELFLFDLYLILDLKYTFFTFSALMYYE